MDGYGWVLIVITTVVCGMAFWLLCRDREDWEEKRENREHVWYGLGMSLLAVGIGVMMCTVYRENDFLFSLKRLCLIAIIWPTAYVDYRTYRIPNSFIGAGLTMRLLIFMAEWLRCGNQAWYILFPELIASGAVFLAMMLCNLAVKNAIGYGDMKLFILMGLMLGSEGIWGAVLMSLIIEFIMAAFLLLTKKKGKKDVIPFGPAIVAGTYISVFLTGM